MVNYIMDGSDNINQYIIIFLNKYSSYDILPNINCKYDS